MVYKALIKITDTSFCGSAYVPSALSFSKTSALILADNSMRGIRFSRAICGQLCDRRYFYLNRLVARIRVIRLRLILTGEQRENGLINEAK